jgi:hypothetical protein
MMLNLGDIPAPRCYHVSCLIDKFLVIQGGAVGSNPQKLESVDTMYALNLETRTWFKLSQSLAPLACYGHSLNIVKLLVSGESVDCLMVFGGYCSKLNACSNNVYICEVTDLLRAAKVAQAKNESMAAKKETSNIHDNSIRWRTLKCTGKFPPPRFR